MNESILLQDGNSLIIHGANKVISSTQSQAVVETGSSLVVISGSDLEVKKLDLENHEVQFSGKVNNIKLGALGGHKQPLLKRIFK